MLIAAALAGGARLELQLGLIERIKATPPLKGMNRRERALALRGAFRSQAEMKPRIEGRAVTLIDDVYTCGATANGCARVLKRAGAERVDIICWARVVRRSDH